MRQIPIFILAIFLLTACKNDKLPQGVLDQQKMVNVLADLTIIDGFMSTLMYSDSLRIAGKNYYGTVYKNHNINKAVFEKSMMYYSKQPVLLDSMYSKVTRILEAKEKTLYKIQMEEQAKILKKAAK